MKKKFSNEKEIVLARIRAYDDDFELSIGGDNTFSKEDVIGNIENETSLGKEIVEAEMEYLRSLISGDIYKDLGISSYVFVG